jgi:hypothetical protein
LPNNGDENVTIIQGYKGNLRMKVYKIYANSQGDYAAAKRGWSWSAFWLTCLWAVRKKIWSMSTVSLSIFFALGVSAFMMLAIPPEIAVRLSVDLLFIYASYLLLGFGVFMGFNGYQWQEKSLSTRGYDYQEMVIATGTREAITFYVKQNDENDLLAA